MIYQFIKISWQHALTKRLTTKTYLGAKFYLISFFFFACRPILGATKIFKKQNQKKKKKKELLNL